jgi:hypothetical protein
MIRKNRGLVIATILYSTLHLTLLPLSGPLAEEQLYGVAFAVEEVALLLKRREFGAGELEEEEVGIGAVPPLTREDLDVWLTARLGSITGQVMSSCKVGGSEYSCLCRCFPRAPFRKLHLINVLQ